MDEARKLLATKEAIRLLSYGLIAALYANGVCAQQLASPTSVIVGELDGASTMSQKRSADITLLPPRVTCQGNQLTIAAENSTLGSVLAAVHSCIGVEIDMPDGAAEDLSYVHLGPGPIREVLDELLGSTQFNYAIQSSNSEPKKISSILLMARAKTTGDAQDRGNMPPTSEFTMTPARRAWLASVRAARGVAQTGDDQSRPVGSEPGTPNTPDNVQHTQASPDAAVADAVPGDPTQAKDIGAPASVAAMDSQRPAVPSEPASAAPSPDQSSDLQNKIGDMRQLFEQRKKIAATSSASPTQN